MAFNMVTGEYDASGPDLSGTVTDNVGYGYVQPDVSNGAPSMSPATPTGNGSGYFIDPSAQSAIFDTLKAGINYAMQKDQVNMQYNLIGQQTQNRAVMVQQQKAKNGGLFMLLAAAGLLFVVLEGAPK